MLDVGATIGGRYLLRERLGGTSSLWRADDTTLVQTVVLKVLPAGVARDQAMTERFLAQSRAIGALDHPGIVKVIDAAQDGAVSYLVTQYVVGESLRSLLRRVGRLTPGHAMALMAEAGRALHAAHMAGVAHGEITPACLLIRGDGRLLLTGFGLGTRRTQDRLKRPSSAVTTAPYLAPEQVRDEPPVAATDIYALGVVAYECLSGQPPFVADDAVAVSMMHTHDDPPALPAEIPATVRLVVERALAKDRAGRWPSAVELAEAAHRSSTQPACLSTLDKPAPDDVRPAGRLRDDVRSARRESASVRAAEPEGEPRATPRRRVLVSAVVASIALVGVGLATLPALASWRGAGGPNVVNVDSPSAATTPTGVGPWTAWTESSAVPVPGSSGAAPSSGPVGASAQPPRPTTTTRTSKPVTSAATKPGTTSSSLAATRYYRVDAGSLSPQFRDGSCVYRIWFANYGSVAFAKIRFYAGACGTPTLRVAAQRGDVMTYESAVPGSSTGTDSCGTYFERQVISSGDPAFAVGMWVRFPGTANTYVYHHVRGGAPPVHRSC